MNLIRIDRRHFLIALVASLAACNVVPVGEGPPRVGVRSAIKMGPAPIKGADAKFAFVEIVGAPTTHVLEFTKAIDTQAKVRNLNIVREGDPSATYLVKGYLSAIGDRKGTLLIYVWDVLDVNGQRLYRVSGQEPAGGSATDPWRGIKRNDVDLVAERTIDDLVAWIS